MIIRAALFLMLWSKLDISLVVKKEENIDTLKFVKSLEDVDLECTII
jgi:hypothetical protein